MITLRGVTAFLFIFLLALPGWNCGEAGEGKEKEKKAHGEKVKVAWLQLETEYQRRLSTLSEFVDAVQHLPGIDSSLIGKFRSQARRADSASIVRSPRKEFSTVNMNDFLKRHSETTMVLFQLKESISDSTTKLLTRLQTSLQEAELEIMMAKRRYNEAADLYNKLEPDKEKQLLSGL
jgi:hypothetical protein